MNFNKHKLSNNEIILSSNFLNHEIIFHKFNEIKIGYIYKNSNITFLQIANQVGSQIESKKEWGIAHILEHMFFKGTKKRPGSINFLHSYNKIGATMNAYTDYDHTNFHITMLNEVFDEGFDIIADMFLNPLFIEEELKRELNPIISEFREKEDDPADYLYDKSMEKFLSDFHSILGTEESIKKTTRNKLLNFKNRYYGKQNMLITAVGGIKPEIFFNKIEEYFNTLNDVIIPKYSPIEYRGGYLEIQKKDLLESYYLVLFPALPYNDKNRFKQNFLSYILGGMDSSLLFERIREELGLSCYEIYSSINCNKSFSVLEIAAGISSNQIKILEKEIDKIIEILTNDLINEERFMIAKNTLKTEICALSETTKGLSSLLLNTLLKNEYSNPIKQIIEEINSITIQDIRDVAQMIFSKPKFIGLLKPV